jgi:hypothetical protein
VQRQSRVDHVLDEQDVLPDDVEVEILEQADRARAPRAAATVACQLDEVDPVDDRQGTRQVGEEDEARLEAADQDRLATCVVVADLDAELRDPCSDLGGRQVDLADPTVGRRGRDAAAQEARSSLYRRARRSMSRL